MKLKKKVQYLINSILSGKKSGWGEGPAKIIAKINFHSESHSERKFFTAKIIAKTPIPKNPFEKRVNSPFLILFQSLYENFEHSFIICQNKIRNLFPCISLSFWIETSGKPIIARRLWNMKSQSFRNLSITQMGLRSIFVESLNFQEICFKVPFFAFLR